MLPLLRITRELRPHVADGRAAGIVDDLRDLAVVSQPARDHAVKFHAGLPGRFYRPRQRDTLLPEHAVDAETPCLVGGDVVRHLVRRPAVDARRARVTGLAGRIVRDFRLVRVDTVHSPFHSTGLELVYTVCLGPQLLASL
jgi:hypothetical protein